MYKEDSEMLTLDRAKELNDAMVTEDHLRIHALNVMASMGAMAEHFGEDREHWMAIGYLHDYDYEQYPEEHLQHTEQPLLEAGLEPANMEKSLYTVDELTGIIQACARMRPNGITDLTVKSFMKKFKDKRFAAKCNREVILDGCERLGMELRDVAGICIEGMKPFAAEIGLLGTDSE